MHNSLKLGNFEDQYYKIDINKFRRVIHIQEYLRIIDLFKNAKKCRKNVVKMPVNMNYHNCKFTKAWT